MSDEWLVNANHNFMYRIGVRHNNMREKFTRYMWIFLGFLCFGLGTLGVVLPILPTVPFYMATVYCFAKSSKRLHSWFTNSRLYKKHLESFMNERAMTMKTKLTILTTSTLVMGTGFLLMDQVLIGRIVLAFVWVFHIWYFFCKIRTLPPERTEE